MKKRSKKSWAKLATRVTLGLLVAGGTLGWAQGVSAGRTEIFTTYTEVAEYTRNSGAFVGYNNNNITIDAQDTNIGSFGSDGAYAGSCSYISDPTSRFVENNILTFTNGTTSGKMYSGYRGNSGESTNGKEIYPYTIKNNRLVIGIKDKDTNSTISLKSEVIAAGYNKQYSSRLQGNILTFNAGTFNTENIKNYSGSYDDGKVIIAGGYDAAENNDYGTEITGNSVIINNGEFKLGRYTDLKNINNVLVDFEEYSRIYGGAGNSIHAETITGNNVTVNGGNIKLNGGSIIGGYSKSLNENTVVNSNTINITGGSIDLVTTTAREESIIAGGVSKVTANLNTVTIRGGNIGVYEDSGTTKYSVNGIVLGGGLFELTKDEWVNYNITANNNAVNISGGTISADIIGGRTAKGQANNNVITITNGDFLTGCRDRQSIDGRIIAGGYTTDGTVQGNTVTISGGNFATETLSAYDGKQRDTLLVAGGYAISAYNVIATVKENKVKISGGVFGLSTNNYSLDGSTEIANGSIFGGMGLMDNYQGNATVTQNLVDISGGTIYGNIFGGYSGSGNVEQNKVKLTGGSFGTADQKINIYAGYSKTGTVSGNSINLSGNLNLANVNLYGSNATSMATDANNVLNLYTENDDEKTYLSGANNSTSINTINNFNTINFGQLILNDYNKTSNANAFLKLSDSSSSNLNNVVLKADSISGTGYLLSGKFSAYGIDTSAIAGASNASIGNFDETSGVKVSESGGVQVCNTTSQTAVDNYILISGEGEAVDKIVAGIYTNKDGNVYVHDNVTGESQATRGTVSVSAVAGTVNKIAGAYNVSSTKATSGGELVVTAGSYAVDLHGGWVDNAENTQDVSDNKVTVGSEDNKVTVTGNIYGGKNFNEDTRNNVTGNEVVVANADIRGTVFGGYTKNGSADNNTVTISGSDTSVQGVYGGYSSSSSNGNTINLLDGKIGDFVYGGYSYSMAKDNTINISGGDLSDTTIAGGIAFNHSNNTLNFFTTDAEGTKSYYTGGDITSIRFFDNINIGDVVLGSTPYVNIVGSVYLQSDLSNTNIKVGNVIGEGKLFQGTFAANENTKVELNNTKLISALQGNNGIKVADAKISYGDKTGTVVADNFISVDADYVYAITGTYIDKDNVMYSRNADGNIVNVEKKTLTVTSNLDSGLAKICGIYYSNDYQGSGIIPVSGGNVTVNDRTVNGTGSIIGAYKYSDASITGNSVTLTNANTNLSICGGLLNASSSNKSEVAENGVIVHGGTIGTESKNTDITGGVASGYASVTENSVTINGDNVYANITGGSSSVGSSTVTKNEVIIQGGNIYGRLIGGEFISAADNIVTITGGNIQKFGTSSFDKGIYGAYGGEQGSASLANNKVNISGGTISSNVYGAYAGYGTVNGNSVNISSGTVNGDVYGGYNKNKSSQNNSVNVSGGKINGRVYAGYTTYSSDRIESNNSVNISGGDLENAALYGGALANDATANNSTLRFYTTNPENQKTYYTGGSIGAISNFKNIDFGNITLSDNATEDKAYIKLVSTTVNSKLDNVVLSGIVTESTKSGYLLTGKFSAYNVNAEALGGFAGINAVKYSETDGVKVGATKGIEIKSKTKQVVDNYIYYNSKAEDKIYAGIYTDAAGVSKANIDGTVSEGATSGSLTLSSDVDTTTVAVAGAYNEATDITKANASGGTLTLGEGTYTGNFYAGYSQNGTVSDNKIVLQAGADVSGANLFGSNKENGTNNVLDARALTAETNINSINNFNIIKLSSIKLDSGVLNLIGTDASNLAGATIELEDKTTARTLLSGNITGVDNLTINGVNKSGGANYAKNETTNSVTKVISGGWGVNTVGENNIEVVIKAGVEGNEIAGLYIDSDGKKYSYADNTSDSATSGTLKLGTVTVPEGKTYAGAYAEAGNATGGAVEISGKVTGAVYAGYAAGSGASVTGNTIIVKGENANISAADLYGGNGSSVSGNTLNLADWTATSKSINSVNGFTDIQLGNVNNITITSGSFDNSVITVASNAQAGTLFSGTFSAMGASVTGYATGKTYAVDSTTNGVTPQGGVNASVAANEIKLVAAEVSNVVAGVYYDANNVGHSAAGDNVTSGALTLVGTDNTGETAKLYAGAYGESASAATNGTVNISGDVKSVVYAGYSESGAVTGNKIVVTGTTDLSNATLNANNKDEATTNNVLDLTGWTGSTINEINRFNTIQMADVDLGAAGYALTLTNGDLKGTKVDISLKQDTAIDDTGTRVIIGGTFTTSTATSVTINGHSSIDASKINDTATNGIRVQGMTGVVETNSIKLSMNKNILVGSYNGEAATGFAVNDTNKGTSTNVVAGGYATSGNAATGGVVTVDGTYTGDLYAGYNEDTSGAVSGNTIKLDTNAAVSGANLHGSNTTAGTNNTLDINGYSGTIGSVDKFNTINMGTVANLGITNAYLQGTEIVVANTVNSACTLITGAITSDANTKVTGFDASAIVSDYSKDGNIGITPESELKYKVSGAKVELYRDTTAILAGRYVDGNGNAYNGNNKTLTLASNPAGKDVLAGAYAVSGNAEAGIVDITGNVTGTIYAGYAENGAVNNNTMNIVAGVDASGANLYGRNESASGSGNVLNMSGANIKVGVVDRFDTINVGTSADTATSVTVVGEGNKLKATNVVTNGTTTVTGNVEAASVVTNGAATVTGNVNATTVTAKAGMTASGNVSATDVNVSGGALNLNGATNTVDNLKATDVAVGTGTVTVNKSIKADTVNAGSGTVNIGTSEGAATVNVGTINAGTGTVSINATGNIQVSNLAATGSGNIAINSGNLALSSTDVTDVTSNSNLKVDNTATVTAVYEGLFDDSGDSTVLSANAKKITFAGGTVVVDNSAADAKVMSVNDVNSLNSLVGSAILKVSDESKLNHQVSIDNAANVGEAYQELVEQSTVEAQKFVLVGINATKADASVDGTIDTSKADKVDNNLSVAKLVLKQEAANDVNGIAIAGDMEVTLGAANGGNVIEVKDSSNNPVDKSVTVLVGSKEAGTSKGTLNLGKDGSNQALALKGNIQIEEAGILNINGKTAITGEVKVDEAGSLNVNNDTKVTGDIVLAGTGAKAANVTVAVGKTTEVTGDLKVSKAGNNVLGNVKVGGKLELQGTDAVLNIGYTSAAGSAAGKLTVNNIALNGGTLFLDPAFVNDVGIEGASSLEVNTADIDGKYIAGKNSVVAFGTMEGATEAFNKFAEVNKIEWAANGVSAAMYIANTVTLKSSLGALMVDGSLTSAPAVTAGSASFADNSLLMVNGSATQTTAAITGATNLNVADSAKLYIAGAEKENTYKIVAGTGIAGATNNWAVENVLTDSAKIKFISASTADLVAYNAYSVSIVDAYDGKVIIDNVLDAADDDPQVNAELKQFIDKATSNKTFDEAHQINAMNSLGAMAELGGVSHAAQLAMEELSDIVANSAPLAENAGGKGISNKTEKSKNVWAKLVHKKDKVASLNVGGMDANYNVNLNGIVVGSDLYDDGAKSAGVALSYMDGKVTGYNMDVKTRNDAKYYGLAMYGRMQQGKAKLIGDVTYLHGDNDLEQYNVVKALAKAKSDSFSVGVRAEADMKLGAGMLTPYAGLRYTRVGIGKYRNSLGLQYDADVQNLVNIPLGLKYSADIKRGSWTIRPSVNVGYVWNLGDRNSTERVSYSNVTDTFGYSSADKGRLVGGVNVAVENANLSYSLGYDYNRSSNSKANRFTLGFQCKF